MINMIIRRKMQKLPINMPDHFGTAEVHFWGNMVDPVVLNITF